ncbi:MULTISPECIES: hypothetical protein [unclassified Lysobacter]|uniref:hypothetical protein n=1 Tax=unclassified Lysobacter TaxID=2635362 RepID=UPI001C21032D|nr:hypothetical protein [Lysobacter sp. MMG2]MBU8974891.1 hypothetical protein [Lysobacter sp. MMG2]
MRKPFAALLATALLFPTLACAASQSFYDKKAAEAGGAGQRTVSLYVDVDLGARKSGSAGELNQAHKAFNANGFDVVSVVGYTENGDLQGFFVTYVRR